MLIITPIFGVYCDSKPGSNNAGMSHIAKFLLEGIDRVGKDTLIDGLQNRWGYFQVLHFVKPKRLDCYLNGIKSPDRQYQEESFRNLFRLLGAPGARIICNRTHLGEFVYAPLYRGYSGEYVFDVEEECAAHELHDARLILLIEDFQKSRHFVDDGQSLGKPDKRKSEQEGLIAAFERSRVTDKRTICVTDANTGAFKDARTILEEAVRSKPT
jgi:hypothetical protein